MSRKYTLDTNVYVDAVESIEFAKALDLFMERHAPRIYLTAVVMQELRAGTVREDAAAALQDNIFGIFERRNRVVAPSIAAFKECGRVIAALSRSDGLPQARRRPSFANDVLIAATCREHGLTLITSDKDFALIRRHIRGFDSLTPWPE